MIDLLKKLVENLESKDYIIVNDSYIGPGLSLDEISSIQEEEGFIVSDEITSFYSQVNGFFIDWIFEKEKYNDRINHPSMLGTDIIGGRINIYLLDELLKKNHIPDDPEWWHSLDSEVEINKLKQLHVLDANVDGAYLGLKRNGNLISNQLLYTRINQPIFELNLNIEEYIHAAVQAKGFYGWQEALTIYPDGQDLYDMYHYIPQLFPDEKLSFFKE